LNEVKEGRGKVLRRINNSKKAEQDGSAPSPRTVRTALLNPKKKGKNGPIRRRGSAGNVVKDQ